MRIFQMGCFFLILLFGGGGCTSKKPLCVDGAGKVRALVEFKSSPELPGSPLENARVSLKPWFAGSIPPILTDASGIAEFGGLLSGTYAVSATYDFDSLKVLVGSSTVTVRSPATAQTKIAMYAGKPGLKINELYTAGPPNDEFYFYDQFIELYNSAKDTAYLDGMVVCRLSGNIDKVTYMFQFPGTPIIGRQYPVPPGAFVVLAGDAIDHRKIIPGSVDLSRADWEFFNPLSPTDPNNPDVPDIVNIKTGKRVDFMLALTNDEVAIATGEDVNYQDGLDVSTILDGVEYQSSASYLKTLDPRIDRGFAGVGLTRYSGMSLERKFPGMDTDNSTVDFHIIPHPTPGYPYKNPL